MAIKEEFEISHYYLPELTTEDIVQKIEVCEEISKSLIIASQKTSNSNRKKLCLNFYDEFESENLDKYKDNIDHKLVILTEKEEKLQGDQGELISNVHMNDDFIEIKNDEDYPKQNCLKIKENTDNFVDHGEKFINSQIIIKADEKLEELFTKVDFNKYLNKNITMQDEINQQKGLNSEIENTICHLNSNNEPNIFIKIEDQANTKKHENHIPSYNIKKENSINNALRIGEEELDKKNFKDLEENYEKLKIKKSGVTKRTYLINKIFKLKEIK